MASNTIYISGQELLTINGIAEHFNVSVSTVQNWEKQGKVSLQRDYTDSSRGTRFILPQDFEELKKVEKVRTKKTNTAKVSEKKRLLTFLSAMNINTVEDFIATYMTQQTFTAQSADFSSPKEDEPAAWRKPAEPVGIYISENATDQRKPLTVDETNEMFGVWIADDVNQPEVKSRADINIDNGKEAVKGCGFMLWNKGH